ncbi:type II secretion system F family protein [Jeongeupia naejangsanensis]|uniref:Type II secretion system F family protein n=1 Tax=Jeongeupia naejangsanensis TaxID=613195 RepID=A0ABS2BJR9_9NEIS|nr:type II secretion system F family protein [Jeongeupia naejangsanensis]MBM3115860.1 type II secretion system F family protein [Jeongeupia naejangsanensis]
MLSVIFLLAWVFIVLAVVLTGFVLVRDLRTERQLFLRLPIGPAPAQSERRSRLSRLARRLVQDPHALRHTQPTRKLLSAAGFRNEADYYNYLVFRIALPVLLGALTVAVLGLQHSFALIGTAAATIVGILLPERLLRIRVRQRVAAAGKELLLLIDLLRMLQGSGMGVGQSLLVVAEEFRLVLPVLAPEIALANQRYQGGRDRRESLEPLATLFESPDFSALAQLMDRLERYGGAAEEPLAKFGERLLEQQRMQLKTLIGQLTVKMTGVMVLFMFPALFILLAGPGMLSLVQTLQHAGGR